MNISHKNTQNYNISLVIRHLSTDKQIINGISKYNMIISRIHMNLDK